MFGPFQGAVNWTVTRINRGLKEPEVDGIKILKARKAPEIVLNDRKGVSRIKGTKKPPETGLKVRIKTKVFRRGTTVSGEGTGNGLGTNNIVFLKIRVDPKKAVKNRAKLRKGLGIGSETTEAF